MDIKFDNVSISRYGLTTLDGTLNALTKAAEYKPIAYNENGSIDGSTAIISDRKMKRREINIPFLLTADSLADAETKKEAIERNLINHEVSVAVPDLGIVYDMVYDGMKDYRNFDNKGKATLFLRFIELNPSNRAKIK